MAISQTAAKPARTGTWPGTYFLSLTVENVRCFGPAQTLDLSDGHGRHAPWTVILGENGLGKTTLLTCLAYIAGVRLMFDRQSPRVDRGDVEAFNFHFSEWLQGQMGLPRADSDGKIESAVVSNEVEIRTGRIDMNLKTCSGRFRNI